MLFVCKDNTQADTKKYINMDDGYLGEIRFFAGNFAPKNWALCQGQLLPISGNEALYAILGIEYGGNGQTNFKLPDFRGRVAISPDSRVDLRIGNYGGQENVALTPQEMPAHTHELYAYNKEGNSVEPLNNILGQPIGQIVIGRDTYPVSSVSYSTQSQNLVDMNSGVFSSTGSSAPHNNMQPYIGMNYIICIKGLFPSRN